MKSALKLVSFFHFKSAGYVFVLILGWFWKWFEGFWKFIEFYANSEVFQVLLIFGLIFWRFVLFYCLKSVLKRPLWLENFLDNKWLQFCGYEAFFCWEIWQKMAKIETTFLNFFVVRFFPVFLDKFLGLIWLADCFASIWIPYWLKGFFWIYVLSLY